MQFFFCLILLSYIFVEDSLAINDTNLIQCTSYCSQIIVSFTEPLVFPPQCQENNDDYALACGIEYKIDYDKEEITIDFQATNDTGSLEDQKPSEVLVQTVWLGLTNTTFQPNTLSRKYACNTNNDCARQSYLNSINYLVTQGRSELDLLKAKLQNDSLIVGADSRRRCIDSNIPGTKQAVKCPNGICYLKLQQFNLNEEQNYKQQRCDYENRPFLFSEIEQHTPPSTRNDRVFLEYRCNKNVCNRDDFVTRIKSLVGEVTNKASNVAADKSITGKNDGLSFRQTLSTSLSFLVLFLFLFQLYI